jgi:ketosteroid isomerase-like protein
MGMQANTIILLSYSSKNISQFKFLTMNTKFIIPGVLIVFVMQSCIQRNFDIKAEEVAILKIDSTWSALGTHSKDVEKMVSYWSDDAVVIPPGEPPVRGKDALRKMVGDLSNIPGFSISWKSSDVHFSPDGKMAYMYGENLFSMNDSTGNKISIPGRGYTIWRKQADGNWKCVVDIWNNPPPAR